MNNKKFKNLIKEALADQLGVVQTQCSELSGISICDLLGAEKSQKLIDAGEILRDTADRDFTPEDIEYMISVIAVAKREFGSEDEEVKNLEAAVGELMNISGQIPPAEKMQSLSEEFKKFKLSQFMWESVPLELLFLILFIQFLAISICIWYDQ